MPFDPNLPIRGRYVRLAVHAVPAGTFAPKFEYTGVKLSADNGQLLAKSDDGPDILNARFDRSISTVVLLDAIAFFIPEHVRDPSLRPAGEELWAEVSVP